MNTANPEPSPPSSAATLARRLGAEFIGTALLVTVVVGSGIAASRLSTDVGLQLLENSIATALGLVAADSLGDDRCGLGRGLAGDVDRVAVATGGEADRRHPDGDDRGQAAGATAHEGGHTR